MIYRYEYKKSVKKLLLCGLAVLIMFSTMFQGDFVLSAYDKHFDFSFEEKFNEVLSVSTLKLSIKKSGSGDLQISEVRLNEENLQLIENDTDYVVQKTFFENGTYEFEVSYRILSASEAVADVEQSSLDEYEIFDKHQSEDHSECDHNRVESISSWSDTIKKKLTYTITDIGSKKQVSSDIVEPLAPNTVETVETIETIGTVEIFEAAQQVSNDCFIIKDRFIIGLQPIGHVGCENSEHIKLDIPSFIDHSTVVGIAMNAFKGNESVTEITLPDTVKTIEEGAFSDCKLLKKIVFSGVMDSISDTALQDTPVQDIYLMMMEKDTVIGGPWGGALGDETNIHWKTTDNTIRMNQKNSRISTSTDFFIFGAPYTITAYGVGEGYPRDVVIPETYVDSEGIEQAVLYIDPGAFSGRSLSSVIFNSNLLEIRERAFYNAGSEISNIDIPSSVTTIGKEAFLGNSGIVSLQLNDGLVTIGESAFINAPITSLTIPDSVTSIGTNAFSGAIKLRKVVIGSGISDFSTLSINEWKALSEITFRGDITSLPSSLFSGLSVTNVYFPEKNADSVIDYPWASAQNLATRVYWKDNGTCFDVRGDGTLIGFKPSDHVGCEQGGSHKEAIIPEVIDGITVSSVASRSFAYNSNTGSSYPWRENPKEINNLQKVIFSDTITSYASETFHTNIIDGLSKLVEIRIGSGIESLPTNFFGSNGFIGDITPLNVYVLSKKYNEILGSPWGANYKTGIHWKTSESCFNVDSTGTIFGLKPIGHEECDNLTHEILNIPSVIDGITITAIADNAFWDKTMITSIYLPGSLTTIGNSAFMNCNSLTSIELPGSLTKIGESTFSFCTSLREVTIGEGITSLPAAMFKGNVNLQTVTIPETVTVIDDEVFSGCTSLSSVKLPSGLKTLGTDGNENYYSDRSPLYGCSSLTSIELPGSLTMIGTNTFSGCTSLREVTLGNGITSIPKGMFYKMTSIETIKLSDSITIIENATFSECTSLSSVKLPSGLEQLGNSRNTASYLTSDSPFYNCRSLTSIELPGTLTTIGTYTFSGCTSLREATLGNGITSIPYRMFYKMTSIETIKLSDSIILIENGTFYECSRLTSVNLPSGLKTLGTASSNNTSNAVDSPFYECKSLTSIELPGTLTTIGTYTFSGCTSLREVIIGEGITTLPSIMFHNNVQLEYISIPDSVNGIAVDTFSGSSVEKIFISTKDPGSISGAPWGSSLGGGTAVYWKEYDASCFWVNSSGNILGFKPTDHENCIQGGKHTIANIPSKIGDITVTSIDTGAFANLIDLTTVTIPDSVNRIAGDTFSGTSVEKIFISTKDPGSIVGAPWGSSLGGGTAVYWKEYDDSCFWVNSSGNIFGFKPTDHEKCIQGGKHTIANIPSKIGDIIVTSIVSEAFSNLTDLTSIELLGSLTTIGTYTFSGCTSLREVTIGEGITSLPRAMFKGNINLQTVTIPETVTVIDNEVFSGCTSLSSVKLPSGLKTLGIVGLSPFYNCSSLTSIELPGSLTTIGKSTFSGCTSLREVTIGEGIIRLPDYMFEGNIKLQTVTIPETVIYIDGYVFSGCTSLSSVKLPSGLRMLGSSSFYNCSSLTSIELPGSLTTIGSETFLKCTSLREVTIGEGITSLPKGMFMANINLQTVTIPETVTIINNSVFFGCTSLSSVKLPSGLKTLGKWEIGGISPFYNCSSLTSIELPGSLTTIINSTFLECISLKEVTIGEGITSLPERMFKGNINLQTVTIPETVTVINNEVFSGCTSLSSVKLPSGLKTLGTGDNASYYRDRSPFYDCSSLTSIELPGSLTTIGSYTFSRCGSLRELTLGNGITSIPVGMIQGSGSIETIKLSDSITVIQANVFSNCSRLKSVEFNSLPTTDGNVFTGSTKLEDVTFDIPNITSIPNYFHGSVPVRILRFPQLSYQESLANTNNPFGSSINSPTFYFRNNGTYFDIDSTGALYTKPVDHEDMLNLDPMNLIDTLVISSAIDGIEVTGLNRPLTPFTNLSSISYGGTKLLSSSNSNFNIPSLKSLTFTELVSEFESPNNTAGPLYASNVEDVYFLKNNQYSVDDRNTMSNKLYSNWGRNGSMRTHFADDGIDKNCFIIEGDTVVGLRPAFHEGCVNNHDHKNLTIPVTVNGASITKIGDYAFARYGINDSMVSLELPATIVSIGSHAFDGNTKLLGLDLPDSVTTIGEYAFANASLKYINLGKGILSIGSHFVANTVLESPIYVPESVTQMSNAAFSGFKMNLEDEAGKLEPGSVYINQIRSLCSFALEAPWGADSATNVYFKGENIFFKTNVTYNQKYTEATINYELTAETGGIIKKLTLPDKGVVNNIDQENYSNSFATILNSSEYDSGKGQELITQSSSLKTSRIKPIVNRIRYIEMDAQDFMYNDYDVTDLTVENILTLSSAAATSVSTDDELEVGVATPLDEIKKALMSEQGVAYVTLTATCRLVGMSKDYVEEHLVVIRSKSGKVSAKHHILSQEEAKGILDPSEFKEILSFNTDPVEALKHVNSTMKAAQFIVFKNGTVGDYTVTLQLGRALYDAQVKVVKEGSAIAVDKQKSLYAYDLQLGMYTAGEISEHDLLVKTKPEYEEIGSAQVKDISEFTITALEMAKLKNITKPETIELEVTHKSSSLVKKINIEIIDDSPTMLIEIPKEIALDKKNGDADYAAKAVGEIRIIADKEHLVEYDIQIFTDEMLVLKNLDDSTKTANVYVFDSSDAVYDETNPLMTLDIISTKSDIFKLKIPNTETIPLGKYRGVMNFYVSFDIH